MDAPRQARATASSASSTSSSSTPSGPPSIQNTRTRDRTAPRPRAAYPYLPWSRFAVCPLAQNSDSKPNLRRYTNGDFDIIVDVRSAEDYAIRHMTGAYNHPGLAFLPSTDDLIPNLGDCKAVAVAVPCALLIANYHPDQQRPPHTHTSLPHTCTYTPTGPLHDWLPGAQSRAQLACPGHREGLRPWRERGGEPYQPHACNSGFTDWQAAGYPTTDFTLAWPAPQCFPENEGF